MAQLCDYRKYMHKAEFDKSVNSLLGLVQGMVIDEKINDRELQFLNLWLHDHEIVADKHPFNELFPVVQQAVADGVISEEEKLDIIWLCEKLTSQEYFSLTTSHMQQLHGILAGVGSDGEITVEELRGISNWLEEHDHLKRCWPYDEVESLIVGVLKDKKIDPEEHQLLMDFFGEFTALLDNKTIVSPGVIQGTRLVPLCSVCPEISFESSVFCFTGESYKFIRSEFDEIVRSLGGSTKNAMSTKVNYLVVGADGNPCWAYACYGRKVERAAELRRQGHPVLIVHETDFHDAIADNG